MYVFRGDAQPFDFQTADRKHRCQPYALGRLPRGSRRGQQDSSRSYSFVVVLTGDSGDPPAEAQRANKAGEEALPRAAIKQTLSTSHLKPGLLPTAQSLRPRFDASQMKTAFTNIF